MTPRSSLAPLALRALRLEQAGVHAMLVGESLVTRPDIGAAVDELLGRYPTTSDR